MLFLKLLEFFVSLLLLFKIMDASVVVTWNFPTAAQIAWDTFLENGSALDMIENGCRYCENAQCNKAVGYGAKPNEEGDTTLDALIMDGVTMDAGAVGGLRNIKNAISVARHVLENTEHTLIVGDKATEFAVKMGFKKESLQTKDSLNDWKQWKSNNCQPNFWKNNVEPNPLTNCGPYRPINHRNITASGSSKIGKQDNHDTIGMIAIDWQGNVAAGTSTNGLNHKISGRVGDSPIPGSGAYADTEVGAAAATGNGDIMMRFNPSFYTVELMRQGLSPSEAAQLAIERIAKHYPKFSGAIIALTKAHEFAAACHGMDNFPYYSATEKSNGPVLRFQKCS